MRAASAGRLQLQFVNHFYVKDKSSLRTWKWSNHEKETKKISISKKNLRQSPPIPLMLIWQWIHIIQFDLNTSAAESRQSFIISKGRWSNVRAAPDGNLMGGKKKNCISAEAAKVLNQPDALALETPELSTASEDSILSQAPFTAPVISFFNLFTPTSLCGGHVLSPQSPADLRFSSSLFNRVGSCAVRVIHERMWMQHSSSS